MNFEDWQKQFLVAFNRLRQQVRDQPSRIRWAALSSKDIEKTVLDLRRLYIDFQETRRDRSRTYTSAVSRRFIESFPIYKKDYEAIVQDTAEAIMRRKIEELTAEIREQRLEYTISNVEDQDLNLNEDKVLLEEFNLDRHRPAESLEHLLDLAFNLSTFDPDEWLEHANTLSVAYGAWLFTKQKLRLDLDTAAERWKKVPHILVPVDVTDRYGAERGSLFDLLDEAALTFSLGFPIASTILCRAICEEVLKRNYGLELKVDKHGHLPGLTKIIDIAQQEHPGMEEMCPNLEKQVDWANGLIHNYGREGRTSEEEEQAVFDFLETVRALIQGTPEQK